MTQAEAAEKLELSDRQIRRLVKRVREEGDVGITHRLRGKPSPRSIPKGLKVNALVPHLQLKSSLKETGSA